MTNIKFLISYHKPAILLKDDILTPIHVGRGCSDGIGKEPKLSSFDLKWMLANMIGDDSGDNISDLNPKFCELTAIYWAWKNQDKLDNPDYIGFMHYRRHFYFYDYSAVGKEFDSIGQDYLKLINYNKNTLKNITENHDLIVPNPVTVSSCYKQYSQEPSHDIGDLDLALRILNEKYPEFSIVANSYINGQEAYFCNMFVMKKDIFEAYCNWLFEILFALDSQTDYSGRNDQQQRVIGFVAERLTGIYIKYLIEVKKVRVKSYPITVVENTEIKLELIPAFCKNNIAVCFSIDENYAKYFSVALKSLMENSSAENNYDVVVFVEKLSNKNRLLLLSMLNDYPNFSLKFVSILPYTKDLAKDTFFVHAWYNITTYYRFFIQDIFKEYDKVLYLDSDLVVLADVAELYNLDLQGNIIGAAQDIEMARWLNSSIKSSMVAYHKKYGIEDSRKYFQAGVLLFDVKQMRELDIKTHLFAKLEQVQTPKGQDQDILNMVCYNRVKYFDVAWNIEWVLISKNIDLEKELNANDCLTFKEALKTPKIIHYCDDIKPWEKAELPLADYFWKYAAQSPFYEQIVLANKRKFPMRKLFYLLRYLKYELLTAVSKGKAKKIYKIERDNIRIRLTSS